MIYLVLASFYALTAEWNDWITRILVLAAGTATANTYGLEDYGASAVVYILLVLRIKFGERWYE